MSYLRAMWIGFLCEAFGHRMVPVRRRDGGIRFHIVHQCQRCGVEL